VGGDFFDWQLRDDGVCNLALGDVMGKGMPAALLMATVRAAMRSAARLVGAREAVQSVSEALAEDLERAGSYVTLFFAQLQPSTGWVTYVDAGHGHVFVLNPGNKIDLLAGNGLPLGVLPYQVYREGAFELQPGATLIIYTDGLTERDPAHPLDHAFLASKVLGATSADEIRDRLVGIPDQQAPNDDLTVLVLTRAA
jgi:serine phosphatase RsbU (regulator of sigma subunit)